MRKIVFLDIDGVLNSEAWARRRAEGLTDNLEVMVDGRVRSHQIDTQAVELLNLLVRPGVEWVLSSTWRGDGGDDARAYVQSVLQAGGWTGELSASTPVLGTGRHGVRLVQSIHTDWSRRAQPTRGDEIYAWLTDAVGSDEQVRIAVLDDDPDVEPLDPHLVHVDEAHGLRHQDVFRAWQLLGEVVVMVDELVPRPHAKHAFFRRGSCHLTVNGSSPAHFEALHQTASAIGLRRSWFQDHRLAPHYDLTASKRRRAIAAGAVSVSAKAQAADRIRRRRS